MFQIIFRVGSWDENTLNINSVPNTKVKSKKRRKSQKICSPYVPISTNDDLENSFSSSTTDEVYESLRNMILQIYLIK